MNGALQFLIDVVMHLMTRHAELLSVGQFKRRVERAPEHDTAQKTAKGEKAEAEIHARPAYDPPEPQQQGFQFRHVALTAWDRGSEACPGTYSAPAAWRRSAERDRPCRNSAAA